MELRLASKDAPWDDEVCKICTGISDPSVDSSQWNHLWIGCLECGQAYHRSCASPNCPPVSSLIVDSKDEPFGVVPLRVPVSPYHLAATWPWTCPPCRKCYSCQDAGDINQCYVCQRLSCTRCAGKSGRGAQDFGPLYKEHYWVCHGCKPSCVNCWEELSEKRYKTSRWCLKCQTHWGKKQYCHECLIAYDMDGGAYEMVQCDGCTGWVHVDCTGLARHARASLRSRSKYFCSQCQPPKRCEPKRQCRACKAPGTATDRLFPAASEPGSTLTTWVHRQCEADAQKAGGGSIGLEQQAVRCVNQTLTRDGAYIRYWGAVPRASVRETRRGTWALTFIRGTGQLQIEFAGESYLSRSAKELISQLSAAFPRWRLTQRRLRMLTDFILEKAPVVQAKKLSLDGLFSMRGDVGQDERKPKETVVRPAPKDTTVRPAPKKAKKCDQISPAGEILDDGLCARLRIFDRRAHEAMWRSRSSAGEEENDEPLVNTGHRSHVPVYSASGYRDMPIASAYRILREAPSKVTVAKSKIAGYGLYTTRSYVRDEIVIEYSGEVIGQSLADFREQHVYSKSTRHRYSCYMFRLDDHRIVDATMVGNAARFINHCCQPNCKARTVMLDGQPKILIVAWRKIKEGEELSYDYRFTSDEGNGQGRLSCACGARKCRGWMD